MATTKKLARSKSGKLAASKGGKAGATRADGRLLAQAERETAEDSPRAKAFLRDAEMLLELGLVDVAKGSPAEAPVMRLANGAPGGELMVELAKLAIRFEEAGQRDTICQAVCVALHMVISTSRISASGYEYRAQLANILQSIASDAAFRRLELVEKRLEEVQP